MRAQKRRTLERVACDQQECRIFATVHFAHGATADSTAEDFADVLLNPIERRLARLLLILARRESEEGPELVIASISQKMLADMLGTSRTHINHFMNKFRQLGSIDYNDRSTINQSQVGMLSRKESAN
jgi:CRP-like cAMP-binding protein